LAAAGDVAVVPLGKSANRINQPKKEQNMSIRKKIGLMIIGAMLFTVIFSSCRRGQGCPKFSIEINESR
jgi:hypothetical protein